MKAKTAQDAFIEQTYGSVEKAIEKCQRDAELLDARESEVPLTEICRAAGHSFGADIRSTLNIPTQNPIIKPDNAQYKSCFKNYDFKADMPRPKIKSGNVDGDVEWGELHDNSVGNWEIE